MIAPPLNKSIIDSSTPGLSIDPELIQEIQKYYKVIYLIDFENTHNLILNDLYQISRDTAYYYIFISKNTRNEQWIMENAPGGVQCCFIQCTTGPNAMDFQLMATAGELTAKYPRGYYMIVSNDKGYQPAIHMLQQKGRHIFQYDVKFNTKKYMIKKKTANTKLRAIIDKYFEKYGLNDYKTQGYAGIETMSLIEFHNSLQKIPVLSDKRRKELYKKCKSDIQSQKLYK